MFCERRDEKYNLQSVTLRRMESITKVLYVVARCIPGLLM